MNRQTDMTENITFPQTTYAGVKKELWFVFSDDVKNDYLFVRMNLLVVTKTRLSNPNWTVFTNLMFAGTCDTSGP